jgi:hypothetical protein
LNKTAAKFIYLRFRGDLSNFSETGLERMVTPIIKWPRPCLEIVVRGLESSETVRELMEECRAAHKEWMKGEALLANLAATVLEARDRSEQIRRYGQLQ